MKQRVGTVFLILALVFGAALPGGAAPNKVWLIPGTPLKFAASGQGQQVVFTMTSLAAGAGQSSDRYDKNALVSPSGAMPYLWRWSCSVTLAGSGVLNDVVQVFIAKSDGTLAQGGIGSTGASVSSNQTKNLTFVGQLVIDAAAANPILVASDYADIRERYFSLVLFNATTLAFSGTASQHACYMTPYSVEIQAYVPLDYDERTAVPPLAAA
jgi:hypothetical protein